MTNKDEIYALKKAIYDKLSPRRRKFIDKIGFDNWDPFQEPKHPIDIRRDITNRTTSRLMEDFFNALGDKKISDAYKSGVYEFCYGLFIADEKYKAMFDFSIWYLNELKQRGLDPEQAWEKK